LLAKKKSVENGWIHSQQPQLEVIPESTNIFAIREEDELGNASLALLEGSYSTD
jgi:hypothetical protein